MKNYKILLITTLSKPWNNGWYYKTGLEKNGCEVIPFDPKMEKDPISNAFEVVKDIRPDLILHTKDELPAEIFKELMQFSRVVQWYPDPVIPDWLPPYVKACHIFLTMSEGLVDEFRKMNPHTFWLSQAFEPSFFRIKEITPEDIKTFSADITFVGNLGSKPQYLSRRRSLMMVAGMSAKEGMIFKWWGPPIPKSPATILLFPAGLRRSYGGKFVWGEEYAKVAKLSKVFLAFDSMPHIRRSMSARMYTAVGCGAFYMCQYVEGIEDVLTPDKEIVTFSSDEEMLDKIRFYLPKDDLRKKIAEAGQTRVLKEHTYEIRMRQMCELIEQVSNNL